MESTYCQCKEAIYTTTRGAYVDNMSHITSSVEGIFDERGNERYQHLVANGLKA